MVNSLNCLELYTFGTLPSPVEVLVHQSKTYLCLFFIPPPFASISIKLSVQYIFLFYFFPRTYRYPESIGKKTFRISLSRLVSIKRKKKKEKYRLFCSNIYQYNFRHSIFFCYFTSGTVKTGTRRRKKNWSFYVTHK